MQSRITLKLLTFVDTTEERAYFLLQWVPYSLQAEFDEELAVTEHYSKLQKQRSNQALNAFDKEHQYECSDELTAFRELERLGVFSQSDFFSPSKAKDAFYSKRLKQHHAPVSSSDRKDQATGEGDHQDRAGEHLAAFAEERRRAGRSRSRHQRSRSRIVPRRSRTLA